VFLSRSEHYTATRNPAFDSFISFPARRHYTPWEFPVRAKYRLLFLKFHPFYRVGSVVAASGDRNSALHVGVSAGAGVEIRAGKLKISPTARYTQGPRIFSLPPARPRQVELLMGFASASIRPSVFGRPLLFGAIIGVGVGDDFLPAFSTLCVEHPELNSLVAGALIEVGLVNRVSVEVDRSHRALQTTEVPVPGIYGRPELPLPHADVAIPCAI